MSKLSRRDEFAKAAMQALIDAGYYRRHDKGWIARIAVRQADALIEALGASALIAEEDTPNEDGH